LPAKLDDLSERVKARLATGEAGFGSLDLDDLPEGRLIRLFDN